MALPMMVTIIWILNISRLNSLWLYRELQQRWRRRWWSAWSLGRRRSPSRRRSPGTSWSRSARWTAASPQRWNLSWSATRTAWLELPCELWMVLCSIPHTYTHVQWAMSSIRRWLWTCSAKVHRILSFAISESSLFNLFNASNVQPRPRFHSTISRNLKRLQHPPGIH